MIKFAFRDDTGKKYVAQSDQPLHHWEQSELVNYIWECLWIKVVGAVLVEVD